MFPAIFLTDGGLSALQLVCIVAVVLSLILSILMCGFFRKKTTPSLQDSTGNDIAMHSIVRKESNSVQVVEVIGAEFSANNNHHNSSCVSDDNNYETVPSNMVAAPLNHTNQAVTTATIGSVLRSPNIAHSSPILPPRNTVINPTAHPADPAGLHVAVPASNQGGTLSTSGQSATAKPDYATINVRQGATDRQTPPASFTSALDETYESIDQVDPAGKSTAAASREVSRQSLQPPMFMPLQSLFCEIRSGLSPSNILSRAASHTSAAGGDNQSTGYARIGDIREDCYSDEADTGSGVFYAIVRKNEVVPKTSKDISHIIAKVTRSNDSGAAADRPAERTSHIDANDNVRKSLSGAAVVVDDTGDYSSLDEVQDSTELPAASSPNEASSPMGRGYEKVDFGSPDSAVECRASENVDYEPVGDLLPPATRTLPEGYHNTHIYEEVTEVSAEIERMQNGNHISKTTH